PEYLNNYPALAAFVEQHPEIVHNPAFFVGNPDGPSTWGGDGSSQVRMEAVRAGRSFLEYLGVVGVLIVITTGIVMLVRTLADQYRWRRQSRLQMDMQNKLIDRFSDSDQLLAYLQ